MRLVTELERYCDRTGMKPTRFGRLAVNDPRLIGDMRRGRRPKPEMIAKLRTFMAEFRP